MTAEFLADRRRALEESFFRKINTELLERLKRRMELESKRRELEMVSGIQDEKLLDRLVELDLGNDVLAALSLVPMIRVAWADGKLSAGEREAILRAAEEAGLAKADPSYHWLGTWLSTPPDEELVSAWSDYVRALLATLHEEDRVALRDGLMKRSRSVAESAGSFLGITNPISTAEQAVLKEIEAAFQHD